MNRLVLFTHPAFITSQSMPRYAQWLNAGMQKRGFEVREWSPNPKYVNLPVPNSVKKWLGYIDQYVLFPRWVKQQLKQEDQNTLFVFTDHALGPWVPLVKGRKQVIHCHDFLAQQSAMGMIPENPIGISGRLYQRFIQRGYRKGKNFIAISNKTRENLKSFLGNRQNAKIEVVYNGLNQNFCPCSDVHQTRTFLSEDTGIALARGYLLHVGGNQWYKNRPGVIRMYQAWRKRYGRKLPLLLVGAVPDKHLQQLWKDSVYQEDIHFLINKPNEFIRQVYAGASLFLFPSLAEGFGWPIAEAMASGSLVLTTKEAPMTEVGGEAAFYLPRMPEKETSLTHWNEQATELMESILLLSEEKRQIHVARGLEQALLFDSDRALDRIASVYRGIMEQP